MFSLVKQMRLKPVKKKIIVFVLCVKSRISVNSHKCFLLGMIIVLVVFHLFYHISSVFL